MDVEYHKKDEKAKKIDKIRMRLNMRMNRRKIIKYIFRLIYGVNY
jgi:hypothetical protein